MHAPANAPYPPSDVATSYRLDEISPRSHVTKSVNFRDASENEMREIAH